MGAGHAGQTAVPLRLVCALWIFWNQRNHFAEGRQWVERALAAASDPPRSLHVRALAAGTDYVFSRWRLSRGPAFCEKALALDDVELGRDRWAVAFMTFILANSSWNKADAARGRPFRAQRVTCPPYGRRAHHGLCCSLARCAWPGWSGDYERARELIDESVALVRRWANGCWRLRSAIRCLPALSRPIRARGRSEPRRRQLRPRNSRHTSADLVPSRIGVGRRCPETVRSSRPAVGRRGRSSANPSAHHCPVSRATSWRLTCPACGRRSATNGSPRPGPKADR